MFGSFDQRFFSSAFIIILLIFPVWPTMASDLKFSGFATLGITHSNSDDLLFRTESQKRPEHGTNLLTESLIGAQLNYKLSDTIDFVAQAVLDNRRYKKAMDYLDLAFIRYQVDRNWAVRFGRVNFNAYLLSEYFHVGYSYLWATPSTEFYTPSSYISSLDGAEMEYRVSIGSGTIQATLAAGTTESQILNLNSDSRLTTERSINAALVYENGYWLWKATLSHMKGKDSEFPLFNDLIAGLSVVSPLWPEASKVIEDIAFDDEILNYYAFGYSYSDGVWTSMSELALFNIDWVLAGDLAYGYSSVGYSYQNFTPYMTVGVIRTISDKPEVIEPDYTVTTDPIAIQTLATLYSAVEQVYDRVRISQQSFAVGFRWNMSSRYALKGQFTRYRINGPGFGLWGSDGSASINGHRNVNVVSVNLSTVF